MYKAICLLLGVLINAQIGIGANAVADAEVLHIESKSRPTDAKFRGLLFPAVDLVDISNSAAPVVFPIANLMVYKPSMNIYTEGFYLYKGPGWQKLSTEDDVLKKLRPTEIFIDTSDRGVSQAENTGGAVGYTIGESPSDHKWVKMSGLQNNITLSTSRNNITISTEGMVQLDNTSNYNGVQSHTFSIGIFIDNALFSVRSYYLDAYGGMTCLSKIFDIKATAQNLSAGNHVVDVYAITRARQSGSNNSNLTWGGPASGCTNINASPMAEGVMAIYLQEL